MEQYRKTSRFLQLNLPRSRLWLQVDTVWLMHIFVLGLARLDQASPQLKMTFVHGLPSLCFVASLNKMEQYRPGYIFLHPLFNCTEWQICSRGYKHYFGWITSPIGNTWKLKMVMQVAKKHSGHDKWLGDKNAIGGDIQNSARRRL